MLWRATLLTLHALYYPWGNHPWSWIFVGAEGSSNRCWYLTPAEVVLGWPPNLPGNSGSRGTPALSIGIIEAEPSGDPAQAKTKNSWGITRDSSTSCSTARPTSSLSSPHPLGLQHWEAANPNTWGQNQLSPRREGTNCTPQMDSHPLIQCREEFRPCCVHGNFGICSAEYPNSFQLGKTLEFPSVAFFCGWFQLFSWNGLGGKGR